ncbi:MAG: S8 family serine peptidase [Vicingaceae bacterium]
MRLVSLLTLFAFICLQSVASNSPVLKLKSGDLTLTAQNPSASLQEIGSQHNLNGYSIVQFVEVPTEAEKAELSQAGINLLEYIPNRAFIAKLNNLGSQSLSNLNIRAITPYVKEFKQAYRLKMRENPDWAKQGNDRLELTLALHLDQNTEEVSNSLRQMGAEISKTSYYEDFVNLIIEESKIEDLLDQPFTKYLDYVPAPPEKEDTRARSLHRGNKLDSDHALGRKYDGTGVSIAIADDGAIGPHIDIKGRVTQFVTNPGGTHGDMTSGIAMGAGNLDPTIKGMATGAYLYYYNISGYPHIGNAVTNLNTRGVVVTSTSYSQGCNNYENTARGIDQQVRQNPELLHVFSAGNSSSSNCGYGAGTPWGNITGGRKQGKSVIATGNLDYQGNLTNSSSRGPSEDGRIKPDICANGTNQMSTDPNNNYAPGGGTSAAAPSIAGLATQLYHGFRSINGGTNPESGLIKASMLNTARDIGNPGPDFFFGWGRVNAHRAMSLLEDNRYLNSTISQGGNNSHTFSINQNLEELRVMVYWTDYEGSTVASRALVNDLDMRLVTPNADTIRPWVLNSTPNAALLSAPATRGVDNLNNVEQVTIDTVPTGTYEVLINGTTIPQGPQSYYVLWETRTDSIEVTYPAGGESFVPGEQETIRWDAVDGTGNFSVQYSADNGQTWNTISNSVNSTRRWVNWSVPSITSGDVLVRVNRGSVSGVSQYPFSIMRQPQNFTADFICPDSVQLRWNPVNGASSYVIYQLGATHMDSIGTSSSTNFKIYNLDLTQENWFSIKAVGSGIESRRNDAFQLPQTPINCPLPYDINITQFNSPTIDYLPGCNVSKIPIRITVNNAGDSTISNIPVKLYANGIIFQDTIVGPLAPNAFQFFNFRDSINATTGQLTISVAADLVNDGNELNDSLSKTITVYNGITFAPPYSFDFETFNTCSTNNNCGNTTCSLNFGWANMPNGVADVHDMRTNTGSTPSNNTGPSFDHNPGTANGKYIYSEASNGCTGQDAYVLSPCFDLSNTVQPEFSFWYHMYGSDMGVLRVDVLVDGYWTNNIITPLFGNQGNSWQNQTINLSNYNGKVVNLRFRITTGSGFESDLALDDMELRDLATSIDEVKLDQELSIFPNPSNGIFNVRSNKNLKTTARVFDLQGRMVKQQRLNGSSHTIDLSQLKKGIYLLDIEGRSKREKLIVY